MKYNSPISITQSPYLLWHHAGGYNLEYALVFEIFHILFNHTFSISVSMLLILIMLLFILTCCECFFESQKKNFTL